MGLVFKNENEYIDWAKKALERRDSDLFGNIKVRRYIKGIQPEVDLIFIEHMEYTPRPKYSPSAFQVKYIHFKREKGKSKGGLNWPYYSGIGQMLATLQAGFWSSHLLHIFDPEVPDGQRGEYISKTKSLFEHLFGGITSSVAKLRSNLRPDQFDVLMKEVKKRPLGLPIIYWYGKAERDTRGEGRFAIEKGFREHSAGWSAQYIWNPYFSNKKSKEILKELGIKSFAQ